MSFGIFYAMMNVAALTSGFAIDGLRLGLPGGLSPKDPASVLASPIRVVVLSTVFSSVAALLVALRFRELPPAGGDCESNSDADTNGSDSDTAINTDTGLRPILRRSPAAAAAAAAAAAGATVRVSLKESYLVPAGALLRERRFWQFLTMALFTLNLKQIFRHMAGEERGRLEGGG